MAAELEAGAVRCRTLSEQDRDPFFRMQQDPAVYLQNGRLTCCEALFRHYCSNELCWALELDGSFAGTCALSENSITASVRPLRVYELSISLLPEFWGRGVAAAGAAAVCRFAFHALHADGVLSGVFSDNQRSIALMQRLGFGRVLFSRTVKDASGHRRREQFRLLRTPPQI